MMQLRPYQSEAVNAAMNWMRGSIDPCLIDAAPAAGKSYMIAAVAANLHKTSGGKRVLCIAPSAELVKQNYEKYIMTGESASVFSASAGVKSTRHVVVFGTPGTVKNSIGRFKQDYAGVIIDECHGITPTIIAIIEAMRLGNPRLRVLGLSGTPYRLNKGYVFRAWPNDKVNGDDVARDPYFTKCVYRVGAREMLDGGFITPMEIGEINSERYDTSGIELLPNGTLNPETVERAFVGHGRKTAMIVADAIYQARTRPGGVMYFAATVKHAHEVLASLPQGSSALVTGDESMMGTGEKQSRAEVIKAYRRGDIRHLVSVGTLTTGFDVSHTETIVLMRYTESAALLQQIMGRAWRLHEGKANSLLLDYADNVDRHFPDGDIYNPVIKAGKASGGGEPIEAECPDCSYVNEFTANGDHADFERDKHGYCIDTFGQQVLTEFGPLSAHWGRRCCGLVRTGANGEYERCGYFWTSKPCPHCEAPNDITARYCSTCKGEIIDPNDKLIADFKMLKKDPTRLQTDAVLSVVFRPGFSTKGNETVRADWVTPYRQFSTWHMPHSSSTNGARDWMAFAGATNSGTVKPDTVTYAKDRDSGFFRVSAYNRPIDVVPEGAKPALLSKYVEPITGDKPVWQSDSGSHKNAA